MDGVTGYARARRGAGAARTVWHAACIAAVAAGLLAVALGGRILLTPESDDPLPLSAGEVFVVPARVDMVGPLVLYGSLDGEDRPSLTELGCVITAGGGPLSTDAARAEGRIVVAGRGLTPLVSFPGREGHSLACTGPGAVAAAPLFVVPGSSQRDLVPLSAFSVAAFLVPVGGAGLLMLRASRP